MRTISAVLALATILGATACHRATTEPTVAPPTASPTAPADPHAELAADPVETTIVAPSREALAGPPRDARTTASGLPSQILSPSSSLETPRRTDTVVLAVDLWDAHGKLLDSYTPNEAFTLSDGMPGMIEGILLMHRGEKRRLWLDEAHQGRFKLASGTVVCDVELVDIVR